MIQSAAMNDVVIVRDDNLQVQTLLISGFGSCFS